ncbi:hypothetical protein BRC94_00080, partial [Halobacteriales archaeon QS_5_70_17]
TPDRPDAVASPTEPVEADTRTDGGGGRASTDGGSSVVRRSTSGEDPDGWPVASPRPTDSIEHVWIGEGYPMGAAKPTVEAQRRRLDAKPSGDIGVAVVVNDPEMRAETAVRDRYGLRELVQFDVGTHEALSQEELASLLAEDRDFVHFVGHVDDRGLQCADGYLDAAALDDVGTRAFVLNACESYTQGVRLVEAGAIAGVVTLAEVANLPATKVGRMLARLLNAGFSLGAALDVLSTQTITGRQYSVVGAPGLTLTESRGSTPILADVTRTDDNRFRLSLHGYATTPMGMGAVYTPNIAANERQYLNSGHVAEFAVTAGQLREFLDLGWFPIRVDGDLRWSDELAVEDVD